MVRATRSKAKKQEQKKVEQKKEEKKPEPQKVPEKKQEEAEVQPEVKAKKYKKKTYDQQVRIEKSKYQRIFLLKAVRDQQQWSFQVQGTRGSQYNLRVSTQVHCSCPDFRFKQVPCKHIYFIITQVGQNEQLLDYFRQDKRISKNAFIILDSQLKARLKARLAEQSQGKDAKQIDLKDDTDCVICFSEMDKETEPLEDCKTCKKYFHVQCIEAWKQHNHTCPLCRSVLSGSDTDKLGQAVIKI